MKNKQLLTIFLVVFVDLLGFGIILPLLPFIAERFNANPAQIGFLSATYSVFQLAAAPVLGRLSDRYGRKKILIISQVGSAIGYLLLGSATSLPLLFVSRIIDGITGGNISIAQAYIADVTDQKDRAKGMGMLGAAFGLGFIFGPAIGGFLARFGYSYPAYFAMGVSLLTVLTNILFLKETVDVKKATHTNKTKFTLAEFRNIMTDEKLGYLVVVFLLLNAAFSVFQSVFALWAQQRFGFGPTENGYVFAYVGILSVIFQLKLLPPLVKRFKEKNLLKYSMFFLFLGLALIPFSPTPFFLIVTQLFLVVGNSMANPSIQALASENVAKEEYGGTLGFLQSAGGFGRIIGPIAGGEIFFRYGKDMPFYVAGAILVVVTAYLQVKLKRT
jgi:DHA1 family tetracycline resistance protein-like MFS transporter